MTGVNRQQKMMELMKHRTTVEKGLTPIQVFNEIYFDLFEQFDKKVYFGMLGYLYQKKRNYIERAAERLRMREEFRWLSLVPCKDERGRVKEHRYVNIKAGEYGSYGYNLLTEVNTYWNRVRHLTRHPEDMIEKEAQEAQERIDEVLDENKRIQAEFDKEQEEKHKALDEETVQTKGRNKIQELIRKEEKRHRAGLIPGQKKLLDYHR